MFITSDLIFINKHKLHVNSKYNNRNNVKLILFDLRFKDIYIYIIV